MSSSFLVYCHLRCSLDGNLVKSISVLLYTHYVVPLVYCCTYICCPVSVLLCTRIVQCTLCYHALLHSDDVISHNACESCLTQVRQRKAT